MIKNGDLENHLPVVLFFMGRGEWRTGEGWGFGRGCGRG